MQNSRRNFVRNVGLGAVACAVGVPEVIGKPVLTNMPFDVENNPFYKDMVDRHIIARFYIGEKVSVSFTVKSAACDRVHQGFSITIPKNQKSVGSVLFNREFVDKWLAYQKTTKSLEVVSCVFKMVLKNHLAAHSILWKLVYL